MTERDSRASRGREKVSPDVVYTAVELPTGRLLPIEARVGRRVVRTIPADSDEGQKLMAARRVEIVRAGNSRRVSASESSPAARTSRPPASW